MDLMQNSALSPTLQDAAGAHTVVFHDWEYAAGTVAEYFAGALASGGSVVAIATAEHNEEIAAALAARGVDTDALVARGRLLFLDAATTLAAVCDDDQPTLDGLRREVGPLLERLIAKGGPVRAYGEMVDLLAAAGRVDAVLAIEAAWAELLASRRVDLLCGYHLAAFDHDGASEALDLICGCHDRVHPPATQPELRHDRLIAELQLKGRLARQAAEQANAARHEAERASRAKDDFLAMLGHELRNPLAPIVNALHLMRLRGNGELEPERALIERQVGHLLRLVEDLLDVSRITRGKVKLARQTVELGQVVAQALETAAPLIAQRAHQVEVAVPTEGLAVEGDPARLSQVVANLLTNAAKYTPGGGRLEVRATAAGNEVVLCVRDDGMGIDPALLPTLFEPFVQGARGRDRSEGGLGLGLAIVQSLVRLHGGSVSAHSAGLGKGAELVVRLPLARAAGQPVARELPTVVDQPASGGLEVLVVDDNVDNAQTLAELLAAMGCRPRVAHDGPAALLLARERQPRLALLDIGLPLMDGYELAARLRAAGHRYLRLVALTGYGQPEDRDRSRRAGFDEHFVKPLPPEQLQRLVAELVAADSVDIA